jgi:endonuclease-3
MEAIHEIPDNEWVNKVLDELNKAHPDAKPELDFTNPFELLIATILSAQCTDKQVNKCTPALFADYPTAEAMSHLSEEELGKYIKPCGFFNMKAKHILSACRDIVDKFGGEVPSDREGLESLAGVGRKTASVVLSNAFNVPAIAVDTHVFRVSNRIGLANAKTVEKTEAQLMERIPEDKWSIAHHWLIFHGRRVCSSQKPKCAECTLKELCRYYKELN